MKDILEFEADRRSINLFLMQLLVKRKIQSRTRLIKIQKYLRIGEFFVFDRD